MPKKHRHDDVPVLRPKPDDTDRKVAAAVTAMEDPDSVGVTRSKADEVTDLAEDLAYVRKHLSEMKSGDDNLDLSQALKGLAEAEAEQNRLEAVAEVASRKANDAAAKVHDALVDVARSLRKK